MCCPTQHNTSYMYLIVLIIAVIVNTVKYAASAVTLASTVFIIIHCTVDQNTHIMNKDTVMPLT